MLSKSKITTFALFFLSILSVFSSTKAGNRFLVVQDFSAIYIKGFTCEGRISFYMKNISNGGISVILTRDQSTSFLVSHPLLGSCTGGLDFGGIPALDASDYGESTMRRRAVYIPRNDRTLVTIRKSFCNCARRPAGAMSGGIVSGNITIFKARRRLNRPISGRF